jgi:hypothetical protein
LAQKELESLHQKQQIFQKIKEKNYPQGRTETIKYTEYIDPVSGELLDGKDAQVSYRVSDLDYLNAKDFEKKYGVTKEYAQDYALLMKKNGGKTFSSEYGEGALNGNNTFVTFDDDESSYTENPLKKGGALITYKVGDISRNAKQTKLVNDVYSLTRSRNNYGSYQRGRMATTTDVFNINISSTDELIAALAARQADPSKSDPLTPQARAELQPKIIYDTDNNATGIQYVGKLEITENLRNIVEGTENKSIIEVLNERNPGMQQGSGMSGQQFNQIFNQ